MKKLILLLGLALLFPVALHGQEAVVLNPGESVTITAKDSVTVVIDSIPYPVIDSVPYPVHDTVPVLVPYPDTVWVHDSIPYPVYDTVVVTDTVWALGCPDGWTCTPPPEVDSVPPPQVVNLVLAIDSTNLVVDWDGEGKSYRVTGGSGSFMFSDTVVVPPYVRELTFDGRYWTCVVPLNDAGAGPSWCKSIDYAAPVIPAPLNWDPAADTLKYALVASWGTERYASAPFADGNTLQDSVWIRVEDRTYPFWDAPALPSGSSEMSGQVPIPGVDSVTFTLDGVRTNREGNYPYEMYAPGAVGGKNILGAGPHTIGYHVWSSDPALAEQRTVTITVE